MVLWNTIGIKFIKNKKMEVTEFRNDFTEESVDDLFDTTAVDTTTEETGPQPTIVPVPNITVSEVLRLLNSGYSRTTKDKAYNSSIGCIQEYFNLTDSQVKEVFKFPALKGKRTKTVRVNVPTVNIIDDTVQSESDENNN
jgi:hypothetical protein